MAFPPPSPHSFGSASFSPPLSRATSTRSSSPSSAACTPPTLKHTNALSSPLHSPATSPLLQPDPSPKPAPRSRNDIFGLSWEIPGPNVASANTRPRIVSDLLVDTPHCLDLLDSPSPSPGPAILDGSLKLRLSPTPTYFLGNGRHATVYAAAVSSSASPSKWTLCAAKRAERGEESAAIREANILTLLNGGKFIVGYHGLVDEATAWVTPSPVIVPSRLTLLLEYCGGGTLFDQVVERRARIGRRAWIRWAIELVSAVGWCKEKGVLIGDLKPQNVLLSSKLEIRLSDFNRSTILTPQPDTQDQPARAGTSSYAAPELVQPNGGRAGWPADVFALALTLWYALTGREPFEGVTRPVERMVLIARGGFWEHECRARIEAVGEREVECLRSKCGNRSRKISRAALEAIVGSSITSDDDLDEDLDQCPSSPTTPSTIRPSFVERRYKDGTPVVWFLDRQSIVDESILEMLKEMSDPDPRKRPEPSEIVRRLKMISEQ